MKGSSVIIGASLCLFGGCTVQRPPVSQPPAVATPVADVLPIAWQSVSSQPPSAPTRLPDPAVVKAVQRYEQTWKFADIVSPTVITYVFQPEREYRLVCPEWSVLTVRLLPGEVLKRVVAGNPVEWMIDDTESGRDEATPVLMIRRAPFAPATEAAFITDSNIYRFMLLPGGKTTIRQVAFYDPDAELQRLQGQVMHAQAVAERQQRAREARFPSLSSASLRTYHLQGDHVPWWPVRVVGDQQHTILELPAGTATALPTLSVQQDGIATRINYRTIPARDMTGPVLVADQAFSEGLLTGEEGSIRIIGGN